MLRGITPAAVFKLLEFYGVCIACNIVEHQKWLFLEEVGKCKHYLQVSGLSHNLLDKSEI